MGEFVAYIGLFVVLGGLVGMVAPRLLRLQRRVHALAVAVAGFVLIGFGASQQQAAVRERARAARAATEAAAVAVPETPAERADRGIIGASVRCVDVVERLARLIALQDDYFVNRRLYPNVDFYSGLIYEAMGFDPGMFPVLFAIGRTAGWVAQWQEMLEDKEQRIARPRQIYTGAGKRDYVAVGAR